MNVYEKPILHVSTANRYVIIVRGKCKDKGTMELSDRLRSGRPTATVNEENSVLITDDKGMITVNVQQRIQVGYVNDFSLVQSFVLSNACVRLVPRMRTGFTREQIGVATQEYLKF